MVCQGFCGPGWDENTVRHSLHIYSEPKTGGQTGKITMLTLQSKLHACLQLSVLYPAGIFTVSRNIRSTSTLTATLSPMRGANTFIYSRTYEYLYESQETMTRLDNGRLLSSWRTARQSEIVVCTDCERKICKIWRHCNLKAKTTVLSIWGPPVT